MRRADAVVTLGENLATEIVRRGASRAKVFLVRNGVTLDSAARREPNRRLRASLGLDGKFVVAYIGSVTRLESLHVLVEAMATLRARRSDVAALIVGDGTEREALERLSAQRGATDVVKFAGRVPHDDVPDYYSLAGTIVCTRGRDRVCELVTPLKPFEAMAYRVPVIVSDVAALREVVRNDETGIVVSAEQPAALAAAIERLADDAALRETLARRAQAWVLAERSWEHVTAAYRDAYDYAQRAFAAHNFGRSAV